MINDPFHPEEAIAREQESSKRKLLAVVCAVAITALLLVGYGYVRKYHAQKVLANNTPAQLQPDQEGVYTMQAPAQDFASIRLAGVKADPQSSLNAYSSSQGKKRSPERLEPRTIVVKRAGKPGEFITSPDNPVRVP